MGIEVLKGKFVKREVLDEEPANPNFDRRLTAKYADKHRGSIRWASGRYYTYEEWKKKREQLTKLTLP